MHASNSTVSNGTDEENSPNTGDDETNWENHDLETRNNELFSFSDDKGLDRGCDFRLCWDELLGEDTIYESCLIRGEGGVDSSAGGGLSSQGDGWNEDLLESSTTVVSFYLDRVQILLTFPCWQPRAPC